MPKRHYNKSDEEVIKKKIRKLEKKLERRHRRRRRTRDTLSSDEEQLASESDIESPPTEEPVVEINNTNLDLNPEILEALGDLMPNKEKYGPPINTEVGRIWSTILKNGLQKENKIKIIEQLLIPENCPLLEAPKLNPEITASVTDTIINRDKKIEAEQKQLGIGLALLGDALTMLINNKNIEDIDRLKFIKMLNDTGRIFTDVHYTQTKARKNLVFPVLDKKFLDIVKDVDRDEYLYGTNLGEKIKILQTCQRSGQVIKKPATITNYKRQGNLNGPPRRNQQRTTVRYGHKKVQSSAMAQKHKYHNPQYQPTMRKPTRTQEKPART